jgi:hypothetical protein
MNARVCTRAFVFPSSRLVTALATILLFVAGCDSDNSQKAPAEATAQAAAQARVTRSGVDTEAGGEVIDSMAALEAQAWITDGNALSLLGVMNARQIAAADVELEAWHSDTVRAFAAAVAREHAEQQHSADSLATRLKIAPMMSALNLRIDTAFRARIDSLRGLSSTSLERGFVHQQVVAEQAIADYSDQLTGAVRAPELRALMESSANAARARLARARTLDASLTLADSMKKAAVADSLAKVAARRAARDSARAAAHRHRVP